MMMSYTCSMLPQIKICEDEIFFKKALTSDRKRVILIQSQRKMALIKLNIFQSTKRLVLR